MYCDKCGKNNAEGTAFCEECGNPLNTEQNETVENEMNENTRKVKLIASIVICVAVVALLIWCIMGLVSCVQNGASEKPIKNYINAMNKEEYSEVFEQIPEGYEDAISENKKEEKKDEWEAYRDTLESMYGDNYKMSYKIIAKRKLSDDEIESAEDSYNSKLSDGEKKFDKIDIEDACQYQIRRKNKGNEKKKESFDTYTVYKIDGKWYLQEVLDMMDVEYDD